MCGLHERQIGNENQRQAGGHYQTRYRIDSSEPVTVGELQIPPQFPLLLRLVSSGGISVLVDGSCRAVIACCNSFAVSGLTGNTSLNQRIQRDRKGVPPSRK